MHNKIERVSRLKSLMFELWQGCLKGRGQMAERQVIINIRGDGAAGTEDEGLASIRTKVRVSPLLAFPPSTLSARNRETRLMRTGTLVYLQERAEW